MVLLQQLTIQQVLERAEKATKDGDFTIAKQLYLTVLQKEPNHSIARTRLYDLREKMRLRTRQYRRKEVENPSQDQIENLLNLYHSGQVAKAELTCSTLLKKYPQSLIILNISAALLAGRGRLVEAVKTFTKISILCINIVDKI